MQNRNWLKSDLTQRRLFAVSRTSFKRRMQRRLVSVACVLMLLALAASLTGCGMFSKTTSAEPQVFPPRPALTEPLPLVTYSKSAQADIQAWQKKLTGTPVTSKP